MQKSPNVSSVINKNITESDIAKAIMDTEQSSYQIGLKFGVAPNVVQQIGANYLGKQQYHIKEEAATERLKRRIALMLKDGIDINSIANLCSISTFAVRQLSVDIEGHLDEIVPIGITSVIDDDDAIADSDTSSTLKQVSIKYMGLELSYTTENDPEQHILELCKLLVGGNYVAS
mgnify:CR=1 FL=1